MDSDVYKDQDSSKDQFYPSDDVLPQQQPQQQTARTHAEQQPFAVRNRSRSEDNHSSVLKKPRRRRTAFTHAQLAFLERKFLVNKRLTR